MRRGAISGVIAARGDTLRRAGQHGAAAPPARRPRLRPLPELWEWSRPLLPGVHKNCLPRQKAAQRGASDAPIHQTGGLPPAGDAGAGDLPSGLGTPGTRFVTDGAGRGRCPPEPIVGVERRASCHWWAK